MILNLRAVLIQLVLLLAIPNFFVFAGTRDPNTPDNKYVEFGQQFPNVKLIRAITTTYDDKGEEKKEFQYGSVVVIKPHWIITAAHVVHNTEEPIVLTADKKFPLSKLIIHGDFKHNNIGYDDLALAYSPESFELEFYPELYTDQDELGKSVTIAGYGLHGTFITGAQEGDGQKRAGHNKIDGTESAVLICKPSRENKLPLEFIITPGDSGGGLFIGNKLAGINSFLMAVDKKPDGTYGDEGAHTRISLYADWINSTIQDYELALQGRATLNPVLVSTEEE